LSWLIWRPYNIWGARQGVEPLYLVVRAFLRPSPGLNRIPAHIHHPYKISTTGGLPYGTGVGSAQYDNIGRFLYTGVNYRF